MTWRRIVSGILVLGVAIFAADAYWPRAITEVSLARQLTGGHCRFVYENEACAQRGIEPLRVLLLEQHDCDYWAIQCLRRFRSPKAVLILRDVLVTKTDVETCDGVVPVRSLAVEHLGRIGGRPEIEALRAHLSRQPMSQLSSGANGCAPRLEDIAGIRTAIRTLERR